MAKCQLFLDIECYRNYFLVQFMDARGRTKSFDMFGDGMLDRAGVYKYMTHPDVEIVTFNGNNYDMPMLRYALQGATCSELKSASDDIIVNNVKPWVFEKKYGLQPMLLDHVDLIEVAPGTASLKIYGARINCQKLQDLPIEPDATIDESQVELMKAYCRNDLRVTCALWSKLKNQVDLRRSMSAHYGVDLRSKSDAQIAEAVLKSEVSRLTKRPPQLIKKVPLRYDSFEYRAPDYVRFITPEMRYVLDTLQSSSFVIKDTGHVAMPSAIDDMDIRIGDTTYKVGIGGLHSQESEVAHYASDDTLLIDRDVRSYYPNLMLNMQMYPESLGQEFLPAYRSILDERLVAKDSGDKVRDSALKIVLNGTFGKTSSKWSILYNPKMMIMTTLTGQLSLLMLIECLEKNGVRVVSANTDGIVIKCSVDQYGKLNKIVDLWQRITKLETEETRYSALYSRDVNSYIAVKLDGSVKLKGAYAQTGLMKNPSNAICIDAVVAHLTKGVPCDDTLRSCRDITKFLTVRRVAGGAVKEGFVLGKAVRWYYAKGVSGTINYKTNGNRVGRSLGAKPLMDLPDEFPDDVNYDWYSKECQRILMDIGVVPRPEVEKLPRKNSKEWKRLLEEGRIELDEDGNGFWSEGGVADAYGLAK